MAVSYTTVFSSSDANIADSASSRTYSTYVPAGLLEELTFRLKGTTTAEPCDGDLSNLIQQLVGRFNGNQAFNLLANVNATTDNTIGRLAAVVESVGGRVSGEMSATAYDYSLTIPLGLALPQQCRFECDMKFIAAAVSATAQTTEIIFKYGASSSATIFGNPTTENLSTAQTMIQVKVPDYGKSARVIGVVVQEPSDTEKITEIICKPLGDFAASPAQWRGRAGLVGGNQFYYPDPDGDNPYSFAKELAGFHYLPMYNLDVSGTSGQVTLLITASEAVSNVQFMPVIALPTKGNGEAKPVQTATVSTSGSAASLSRAEE